MSQPVYTSTPPKKQERATARELVLGYVWMLISPFMLLVTHRSDWKHLMYWLLAALLACFTAAVGSGLYFKWGLGLWIILAIAYFVFALMMLVASIVAHSARHGRE